MTVRDLLQFYPMMSCLCGKAGMDREIRYIDIVEIPEGPSWVAPGDFIITTGFFFRSNADFERLVRCLLLHQVSGLGIKLGKYVQELPAIICELAEAHSFPIISIPIELSYREIQQINNGMPFSPQPEARATEHTDMLQFFHEALFGNSISRFSLEQMAQNARLSEDAPWLAAVAEVNMQGVSNRIAVRAAQYENEFLLLSNDTGTHLVAVFSPRGDSPYSNDIEQFLQHFRDCCEEQIFGIGEPVKGPTNISNSYRHALFALKVGKAVAPEKREHYYMDYLDYAAVSETANDAAVQLLTDRFLQPLYDHDACKHAQLMDTLKVLDRCGYNMALAAQALYIHRNTLYARVSTISQLLKVDLRDVPVQYAIHLALTANLLSSLGF